MELEVVQVLKMDRLVVLVVEEAVDLVVQEEQVILLQLVPHKEIMVEILHQVQNLQV